MKISIITINRNNANGLENTIESIICQTFDDFEYIVIDGGSTDASVDIIRKYADKISYWISEPDNGVYSAMNKGIKAANGEYLLFINSGDILNTPNSLISSIHLEDREDIIYFNLLVKSPEGQIYEKVYPDKLDINYFLYETLPHPASFIKKELFSRYGNYNENFKIVSDWAFFTYTICKKKCTYRHYDKVFSTFYTDGISSSPLNISLIEQEKNTYIKRYFPSIWIKSKIKKTKHYFCKVLHRIIR